MPSTVEQFLGSLDSVNKDVKAVKGVQIWSATILQRLHDLATTYFSDIHPIVSSVEGKQETILEIANAFSEFHALARKNPATKGCLDKLKRARKLLVVLEAASLSRGRREEANVGNRVDALIVESLSEICDPAARSYQQALNDLASESRLSYRGPATDLRESLRETLDVLAPDKDVQAAHGFKLELDTKHPTMKQKMRFVLKNRDVGSSQISTSDAAVNGIESVVGDIFRSVYTRSSVSTHTVTNRAEVLRILGWVRLMMCELLEVPTTL